MPQILDIDDYSPLIQYGGEWHDSSNISPSLDPNGHLYRDGTFHSTQINGSTATITFRGVAISIFGAKRINHGFYHVSVDGEPGIQFNGYAGFQPNGTEGIYQFPLFHRDNLTDGQHSVTLTNIVTDADYRFVDIDYIQCMQSGNDTLKTVTIQSNEFQSYTPASSWNSTDRDLKTYRSVVLDQFAASLTFWGNEISLYGSTGPDHGRFQVQIDNQQPLNFTGAAPVVHPDTLLYFVTGLREGKHQLVVTNLEDGRVLDVNRAVVVPTNPDDRNLGKGAIAGIIVGAIHGPMNVDPYTAADRLGQRTPETLQTSRNIPRVNPPGRGRGKGAIGPAGPTNRGVGLQPATVTTEGSISYSETTVETDAGALPPLYDQIQTHRIANLPVRSGIPGAY
ncbi:hypothetical protein RhiLY_11125 [Ceratobasidium sp. AG-Ba]|nr:hypothetical protein RhiLY_11125 [Ceratobasidium sp. AG-Ba]